MRYPFTVVLLDFTGKIHTFDSWGNTPEEAAAESQGYIRTPTYVVATISGKHENKHYEEIGWLSNNK